MLPVFGTNLVILLGNKNLILINFQLVTNATLPSGENILSCLKHFENKLQSIYNKYQHLPQRGDILLQARRFILSYALWTRLDNNFIETIKCGVFFAFKDYFNLYLEEDYTAIHNGYLTY